MSSQEGSLVKYSILINYTTLNTGANFLMDDSDLTLITTVSSQTSSSPSEYVLALENEPLYNDVDGCHNPADNPIFICTCVDLNKVRDDLTADYVLLNDIDFVRCADTYGADYISGEGWLPIGDSSNKFIGTFDGGSYAISNLYINRPSLNQVGLFGFVLDGTTSSPVVISNLVLDGTIVANGSAGAVTGSLQFAAISNITSSISITTSGNMYAGGLVGFMTDGHILDSSSTGDVTGDDAVGGLVAGLGSTYSGNVIRDSYASGDISGVNYVGGLGATGGHMDVENSYFSGTVNGASYVGGLVGYSFNTDISNSYVTGQITCTTQYCGGLSGGSFGTDTFSNSTWVDYPANTPEYCLGTGGSATGGSDPAGCSSESP